MGSFVPAYQPQSPWVGAYPQVNRLMAVHVQPQPYLVYGGSAVYVPPHRVVLSSPHVLSHPRQYGVYGSEMEIEDLYPYGFGFSSQSTRTSSTGAGSQASGTGTGMMPFFLEPEDRQQYEMYKRGIITTDFDASELAQYQAMAQAEGITVPGQAGSSTGTATAASSTTSSSSGTSGTSSSTGSSSPTYSNVFGGWVPFMGMESEDIAQYAMYKNGVMSPDMDAAEIAQYQAYDQYQQNQGSTTTTSGRRKL